MQEKQSVAAEICGSISTKGEKIVVKELYIKGHVQFNDKTSGRSVLICRTRSSLIYYACIGVAPPRLITPLESLVGLSLRVPDLTDNQKKSSLSNFIFIYTDYQS